VQDPITLLGTKISRYTLNQLLDHIEHAIQDDQQITVGNVNIYAMNLAFEDAGFRKILNGFDIVFCDGFGVKLGAALSGKHIPERYTPPDFLAQIIEILIRTNGSLYLLGAKPGIAEKASRNLHTRFPELSIAGFHHGYFDKQTNSDENDRVVKSINSVHPSVLLVAFGMPMQEKWISENRDKLNTLVILPVGALLDTLSGEVHRGPKFLTDHGFEWLARLVIEPKRLWKRYLIGNPLFFWRVIKQRWGSNNPKPE
jgi:N-acetylglucosaminyldiphosphoundecaprenol N-acetyl-beta-D-mannosaminyltransferase